MSFLRRISNAATAFFPSPPNTHGLPPHVPRRATETGYPKRLSEEDEDDVSSKHSFSSKHSNRSRASWELSDSESVHSHQSSASSSQSYSESDSDDEAVEDRYDMMVRHLWGVGERSGWFRDADFDGLVSIR